MIKKYKGLRWDVVVVKGSIAEGKQWIEKPEDDLNKFVEQNNITRDQIISIVYEDNWLVMYYWE